MPNFMTGFMDGYNFVDKNRRLDRQEKRLEEDRSRMLTRQQKQDSRNDILWEQQQYDRREKKELWGYEAAAHLLKDEEFAGRLQAGENAAVSMFRQTVGQDPRNVALMAMLENPDNHQRLVDDLTTLERGFQGQARKEDILAASNRTFKPFLNYGTGGESKRIVDIFPGKSGEGFYLELEMEDEGGKTKRAPLTPNRSPEDTHVKEVPAIDGIQAIRMLRRIVDAQILARGGTLAAQSKPKQQIVNGQLVTVSEDGASAQAIQGFQPKAPVTDFDKWLHDTGRTKSRESREQFRKEQLELKKAGATRVSVGGDKGFKNEMDLRKEFNASEIAKNFNLVEKQAGRIRKVKAALEDYNKNPGGKSLMPVDQALITIFNKMMDENSVVRESEYARTQDDQAVLSAIRGKIKKILSGGAGLTDVERNSLVQMIEEFRKVAEEKFKDHSTRYKGIANDWGFDPGHILGKRTLNLLGASNSKDPLGLGL